MSEVSHGYMRRKAALLLGLAVAAGATAGYYSSSLPPTGVPIAVYRDAYCSCCKRWAAYMRGNGFAVVEHVASPLQIEAIRAELGVPPELRACHLARIGDQFIVGHVPAESVSRMLRESGDIGGVGVQGHPFGSPGMDTTDAGEPYEVVAVFADGETAAYERR